jgi:hypothetical protein
MTCTPRDFHKLNLRKLKMKNTCKKVSKASSGSYDFLKFPKKTHKTYIQDLSKWCNIKHCKKKCKNFHWIEFHLLDHALSSITSPIHKKVIDPPHNQSDDVKHISLNKK